MIKGIKKANNKLLVTILNYFTCYLNYLASVKEKNEPYYSLCKQEMNSQLGYLDIQEHNIDLPITQKIN